MNKSIRKHTGGPRMLLLIAVFAISIGVSLVYEGHGLRSHLIAIGFIGATAVILVSVVKGD